MIKLVLIYCLVYLFEPRKFFLKNLAYEENT